MGDSGSSGASTKFKVPKDFRAAFEPFRDYAIGAFNQAQAIGPYGGPWVAPVEPKQREALGGLTDLSRSRATTDFARPVIGLGERMLAPGYTDVGSDPIVQNAIRASAAPIRESEMDALNRARAIAGGAGVDLGSRAPIVEQNIMTEANRLAGDTAARIALGELANREQLQAQEAPRILTGGYGLQETAPRLLGEVGGAERQLIQETVVQPAQAAYNERLQALLRPMVPMQQFFGATPLPYNQIARSSTDTGTMGTIQGIIGGLTGMSSLSNILGGVMGPSQRAA